LVGTTKCFWYNSASCIAIASSADCAKVTAGSALTFDICQAYSTSCSVNRAGTACIAILATCTAYGTTMTSCVKSTAGFCASNALETSC
jgi:Notch-like protein